MRISLDAARLFLDYLDGRVSAGEVLRHPAYAAIKGHADRFGDGLDESDIEAAREGLPSRFLGLRNLRDNLPRILGLMQSIEHAGPEWSLTIEDEMRALVPHEDLNGIVVYPVIGYDWGIGHDGVVSMNLNSAHYLGNHHEFLYWAIHETYHVVYERYWQMPFIKTVHTSEQWLSLLHLALQNEGYATYAPLAIRLRQGAMDGTDYRVLQDATLLKTAVEDFLRGHSAVMQHEPLSTNQLLDLCFGSRRLAYPVGCELVRRVEREAGPRAVQEGALMNCDELWRRYGGLLEASRPEGSVTGG
jgi:hypothetical protein